MALFQNLQLTQGGQKIINDYILGSSKTPISLTAIAIGDGKMPTNLTDRSSLVHEVRRLAVETSTLTQGILVVTARLSTDTITADITHREIGLYSGSTLFAYGNSGEEYDYIPAAGKNTAVVKLITVRITVGTIDVKLETFPADDYVTYAGLEQRVKQEVADTVPNEVQTNFNRELPNAVQQTIDKLVPSTTAEELKKQLPEALPKELSKQLPAAVENEVHTLIDAGRVNEIVNEEVVNELNSANITTITTPDPTATQQAKFIQLSAEHTTIGKLDHITIDTKHSPTTNVNSYLLVWEMDEVGGWAYCGTSHNNPRIQNGQSVHYDFRGVELHGRPIRLALVPTQEGGWPLDSFVPFLVSCLPATTGDMNTGDTITPPTGSPMRKTAHVTLGICGPRYATYQHYLDADRHLRGGERENWDAAADAITAHAADTDAHLQPGERDGWNAKPTAEQVDTKISAAKNELEESIRAQLSSVLSWRGSVATVDALPQDAQKGDVYDVQETGSNYAWTGEAWDDLGPTLNGYLKTETFSAHATDAVRHVDAPARAKWDAAAETITSHTADADAHLRPGERDTWNAKADAAAVQTALTEAVKKDGEMTASVLQTATMNAVARYIQLDARYVPSGKLTSITIRCRSNSNNTVATTPAFLGIWEEATPGAADYKRIAASTDAQTQAPAESRTWHFDPVKLQGNSIRLCLLETSDSLWPSANWLGIGLSVEAREENDTVSRIIGTNGNASNHIPVLSFAYLFPVDKFAPVEHAENAEIHLNEQDREALNNLLENPPTGTPGANGVTFTPHVSEEGVLSWTNDGNLQNPPAVSIKGEKGEPGDGSTASVPFVVGHSGEAPALNASESVWLYDSGQSLDFSEFVDRPGPAYYPLFVAGNKTTVTKTYCDAANFVLGDKSAFYSDSRTRGFVLMGAESTFSYNLNDTKTEADGVVVMGAESSVYSQGSYGVIIGGSSCTVKWLGVGVGVFGEGATYKHYSNEADSFTGVAIGGNNSKLEDYTNGVAILGSVNAKQDESKLKGGKGIVLTGANWNEEKSKVYFGATIFCGNVEDEAGTPILKNGVFQVLTSEQSAALQFVTANLEKLQQLIANQS